MSSPLRHRPGHVGLNVTDLDRSIAFYTRVLELEVVHRSAEPRPYAFLADADGLRLTLWQQAARGFDGEAAGLHHLSFEVASPELVLEVQHRLSQLGATVLHGGAVAHRTEAGSGGVFFLDPDGIRLEVYSPTGLQGAAAPSGHAPTCGFF